MDRKNLKINKNIFIKMMNLKYVNDNYFNWFSDKKIKNSKLKLLMLIKMIVENEQKTLNSINSMLFTHERAERDISHL